jgi:hypothetical protein
LNNSKNSIIANGTGNRSDSNFTAILTGDSNILCRNDINNTILNGATNNMCCVSRYNTLDNGKGNLVCTDTALGYTRSAYSHTNGICALNERYGQRVHTNYGWGTNCEGTGQHFELVAYRCIEGGSQGVLWLDGDTANAPILVRCNSFVSINTKTLGIETTKNEVVYTSDDFSVFQYNSSGFCRIHTERYAHHYGTGGWGAGDLDFCAVTDANNCGIIDICVNASASTSATKWITYVYGVELDITI